MRRKAASLCFQSAKLDNLLHAWAHCEENVQNQTSRCVQTFLKGCPPTWVVDWVGIGDLEGVGGSPSAHGRGKLSPSEPDWRAEWAHHQLLSQAHLSLGLIHL